MLLLPVLLLTTACKDDEMVTENERVPIEESVANDSLEIYWRQIDKGNLIGNSVILQNEALVLDLTLEDALSLGIDQTMYETQKSQIETINSSNLLFK